MSRQGIHLHSGLKITTIYLPYALQNSLYPTEKLMTSDLRLKSMEKSFSSLHIIVKFIFNSKTFSNFDWIHFFFYLLPLKYTEYIQDPSLQFQFSSLQNQVAYKVESR